MNLRKVIFWLHLVAAISAGVVILVMSATGVLLAFEKQILSWTDRDLRQGSVQPGAERLPMEKLVSTVRDATGAPPTALTFYAGSPAVSSASGNSTVYVNAYTGQVLGTSSTRVRAFFRTVTDLHRYLAMAGDSRATGKAVTGASNLVFLFLVASGFFLWWPNRVFGFKRGVSGKARNWNWHNVFGFWTSVPLFLIVLSATVISYPWASNLVYRITGTEAPPAQNRNASAATEVDVRGLDALVARAEGQVSDWTTINLRLPANANAPVAFTIDRGSGGQPQLRSTLTMDRTSGEIVRWERFEDQNTGRRARSWLRFVHTGEFYGLPGQAVAAIASFAGVMLVWTGFALSWKRLKTWASSSWGRRDAIPTLQPSPSKAPVRTPVLYRDGREGISPESSQSSTE